MGVKKSLEFTTVKIPVTKVNKAYLEMNFGKPVTFPEKHIIHKLASAQLGKNNTRKNNVKDYPAEITLSITLEQFRHDGFEITDNNVRNFNSGVDNHIKILCNSNIDALLIASEKQRNWKEKFRSMLDEAVIIDQGLKQKIRALKKELEEQEINIQMAIETVVYDFLNLDFDILSFEAVKQDYFRYRKRKKISAAFVP